MLPSNTAPITSPLASISGEPELPPMMSLVVEMSNTVVGVSLSLASTQRGSSLNGSSPVARLGVDLQHEPDHRVVGGLHRLEPAVPQGLAQGRVAELRFGQDGRQL